MCLKENSAAVPEAMREQPSNRHRWMFIHFCDANLACRKVQQLKPIDYPNRRQNAIWAEDNEFHRKIIFSDKAPFHLDGCV